MWAPVNHDGARYLSSVNRMSLLLRADLWRPETFSAETLTRRVSLILISTAIGRRYHNWAVDHLLFPASNWDMCFVNVPAASFNQGLRCVNAYVSALIRYRSMDERYRRH